MDSLYSFLAIKMIVVGDVHGDLNQFIYPLKEFLGNRNKYSKLIYLGDYSDRGSSDVYIYEFIKLLKSNPNIIFLKGNHEFGPCTYDNQKRFNENKFMYSFMLQLFKELDLPIVHIEGDIVFSHSYLRHHPLEYVKKINKMKEEDKEKETWNEKKECGKDLKEFANIYGHEHSSLDEWKDNKLLCIDFDSSYGFRKVNKSAKLFTLPRWIVINDGKIKMEKPTKIYIGSEGDMNSKPFTEIAKFIGLKLGNRKLFKESYDLYMSLLNNPKNSEQAFMNINNIKDATNTGEKRYFDNVPIEFYDRLGYKMTGGWMSPDKFYENVVVRKQAGVIIGGSVEASGNSNLIVYIILLALIIMVIIRLTLGLCKNKIKTYKIQTLNDSSN